MNAAAFFAAAARLPIGSLGDITGGRGLVVVAPHPDDESLGCGALVAEACAQGARVRLVVVSDGAGSHPGSRRYPPERLRALREAETRDAAAALGLAASAIRFLGLPDRCVPSSGAVALSAQEAIVAAVRDVDAGAICVTWLHDPHCDHCGKRRACRRSERALRRRLRLRLPCMGCDAAGRDRGRAGSARVPHRCHSARRCQVGRDCRPPIADDRPDR